MIGKSGTYRIRVKGRLDERWSDRLAGMQISTSQGANKKMESTLVGRIRDQAELAGVLNSLYEMHLSILSVDFLDKDKPKKKAGTPDEPG